MAKLPASVSCPIPPAGEQTHSPTLELGAAIKVSVQLPAIGLRPGKSCHVTLQWNVGGSFYGIPGAAWRLGAGQPVKQVVTLPELPEGATGVRLSLFTEVEACTAAIADEAKVSLA